MSEEEINNLETDLKKFIPKVEISNTISAYGGVILDDLIKTVKSAKKVPSYEELIRENQQLKQQLEELNIKLEDRAYEQLKAQLDTYKQQLEYLRSGEYINQLRYERDMLQDLVDNGKISQEDKEFIDMTHRNTELLEQLEEEKNIRNKAIEFVKECSHKFDGWNISIQLYEDEIKNLLQILQNKQ